jgi:S1-C subfamily serine protease
VSRLVLAIRAGARVGQREEFTRDVVTVGRHANSDLRFDAHRDLEVSSRHAEFRCDGSRWTLTDLDSVNGTSVNGERITAPVVVAIADTITFGVGGPRVEILAAETGRANADTPRTVYNSSRNHVGVSTDARIDAAVARHTQKLNRVAMTAGAVVLISAAALAVYSMRTMDQSRRSIADVLSRSDSLNSELQRALASAAGREAGLDSALSALKRDRDRLARALRDGGNVTRLSSELSALDRRTTQMLGARALDYGAIAAANARAVAYIVIEEPSAKVYSGTAFSITPTGVLVTSKHLVQDGDGRTPTRIGVLFSGTDGPLHSARVTRVSSTSDLAFLQIESGGEFPAVQGVASGTVAEVGDALAVLGFPMGTTLIHGAAMTASLTGGLVGKVVGDTLQLDAFAAEGSSGSPVFDARGLVVGVVYGGAANTNGRVVYALSGARLAAELRGAERAIVR